MTNETNKPTKTEREKLDDVSQELRVQQLKLEGVQAEQKLKGLQGDIKAATAQLDEQKADLVRVGGELDAKAAELKGVQTTCQQANQQLQDMNHNLTALGEEVKAETKRRDAVKEEREKEEAALVRARRALADTNATLAQVKAEVVDEEAAAVAAREARRIAEAGGPAPVAYPWRHRETGVRARIIDWGTEVTFVTDDAACETVDAGTFSRQFEEAEPVAQAA